MAATMSTSMPTKLPEASVYSTGLNTVSVAMTQVLPEPAVSAEAASEEALSAAEEAVEAPDVPPQAARDSAMAAAIPNASSFFIVYTFPLYPNSGGRTARDAGVKKTRATAIHADA